MEFEFRFGQPATSTSTDNGTFVLHLMNRQIAGSGRESWPLAPDGELVEAGDLWEQLAFMFDQHHTASAEQLNVVQADICRPELLVEVEMLAMSLE